MLRWGFKKQSKGEPGIEPQSEASGVEWDYLRGQPDFDADEMAGVRSRQGAAWKPSAEPLAPVPEEEPEAGITRPLSLLAELAPGFQDLMESPPTARTAPARRGPLLLEVTAGRRPYRQTIYSSVLIGRRDTDLGIEPAVDLAADHAVSRRHAVIRLREDGYWLLDLQSTNGTLLNGRRLIPGTEVPIGEGDQVDLGAVSRIRVLRPGHAAPDDAGAAEGGLTPEDRRLGELLEEARGAPLPGPAPAGDEGDPDAVSQSPPADLLDLALERGGEVGLLRHQGRTVRDSHPAKSPCPDAHRRRTS